MRTGKNGAWYNAFCERGDIICNGAGSEDGKKGRSIDETTIEATEKQMKDYDPNRHGRILYIKIIGLSEF